MPEARSEHPPISERVTRPHMPLGLVVVIACVAQFMVVLDTSIVNVALPDMKTELSLSVSEQQWVVNGYLITFGGFLLLASRASDLLGRKRVFQAGLIVFTAASLAGGLAQEHTALLISRIVQGIGAAAVAPASLSLITASHPEGTGRTRALSIWSAAAAGAGAVGLVLGGVLTSSLSWRYVLLVNVPIGIALFITTAICLERSVRSDRLRLDIPGSLTITIGIGALTYGISESASKGWGSATVIASLVVATALVAAFVVIEAFSRSPLVPLRIFRYRGLSVANVIVALVGVGMTASLFFLSLYLQQALGYSAVKTGLAILPMTVVLMVGALGSRRLIPVLGPRSLLLIGGVISAVGLFWLSFLPTEPAYVDHILLPTLVVGLGTGLTMLPVTEAATNSIPTSFSGLASGLLNMGRQIGGAIGLAVLVTVSTNVAAADTGAASPAAATVSGYHVALVACAAVSLAAGFVALLLPKTARSIGRGLLSRNSRHLLP